jgi:hypothetical protein
MRAAIREWMESCPVAVQAPSSDGPKIVLITLETLQMAQWSAEKWKSLDALRKQGKLGVVKNNLEM